MEEFLKNNYALLNKSIILIAVFFGFIFYRKYKGTAAIIFIKIVFTLFVIDLIGSYTRLYGVFDFFKPVSSSIFRKNYWWFTLTWDIGVITLFSILYQKIIENKNFKFILKIITLIYICFAIIFLLINYQGLFHKTFPLLQILGAIIILLCCSFYLFELMKSDSILNIQTNLYFYITVGIFMWWIILTPLSFYDLYFVNADWNFIILKWQMYLFANFFMYTAFTIGLIVSKPDLNLK